MTISQELIKEQNEIINSKEKKIAVYAGPGSGKTYTLIQKIIKDTEKYTDINGFIALSFTKKASSQLREKAELNIESDIIENSEILTTDAFIYKYILFNFFKYDSQSININMKYADSDDEKEFINLNENSEQFQRYFRYWYKELRNGTYILSFMQYYFAKKYIEYEKSKFYYSSIFKNIYIDEAQDMNKWQFDFFNKFAESIYANIMYVGDEKQSLYRFRGARPELFLNLREQGFTIYNIFESARCPENILDFSMAYIKQEKTCIKNFEELHLNERLDVDFINNNECLFLAFTRKDCESILTNLVRNKVENSYFVEEIKIDSGNDETNSTINDILHYYVNKKLMILFKQQGLDSSKNKEIFISYEKSLQYILGDDNMERLKKVYTDVELSEFLKNNYSVYLSIEELLENKCHLYYYDASDNINKIMTIHSSKGLESDNVFVRVNYDFNNDDKEARNRYFVAFTRAKKNLFISCKREIETSIKNIFENC